MKIHKLLLVFFIISMTLVTSVMAQSGTGACSRLLGNKHAGADKCWCDSGQPIGSCLSRLSERGEGFPTAWDIALPGDFYGFSMQIDKRNHMVYLYYYGQLGAAYPIAIMNAEQWTYRNDTVGDYYISGQVSFYIDTVLMQLKFNADQIGRKTSIYLWNKQVCINGLCYVSN